MEAKYCHKCGAKLKLESKFCPDCGASLSSVPNEQPKKHRKSPATAAVLNFLLPPIGYMYLEKWWGVLLLPWLILEFFIGFVPFVPFMGFAGVLIFLSMFIIDGALAFHAWHMAKEM